MSDTAGSGPNEAKEAVALGVHQAADAAVQVSGMVVEQASQVTREVSSVAVRLADDVKSQLRDRAEAQLGQLADGMDAFYHELRALAEGRPDEAGPLVEYAHEGADRLGDLTQHIHEVGVDGVALDIKRFARRRPVVFLTGSVLAGLAIGRLLRNEAAAVQGRLAQNQLTTGETADKSTDLASPSVQESQQEAANTGSTGAGGQ